MKKFVVLLVAVMLLVAAGSAFAAHGPSGGDDPFANENNNTTNNNSGGTTPTPTPGGTEVSSNAVTQTPATYSVLTSNTAVLAALLGALNLPAGTVLLSNSIFIVGTVMTAADAQAAVAALTSFFRNAAALVISMRLPSTRSPRAGVGLFGGASWGNEIRAHRGHKRSFLMVPRRGASASGFAAAADPEPQIGQFLDANGNVITGDLPAEGDITASAYMEANVEYDPMVVEGTVERAASGDNPAPGTDSRDVTPAPGGNTSGDTPAPGGNTPAPGGNTSGDTPAPGGNTSGDTPAPGDDTPAPGGNSGGTGNQSTPGTTTSPDKTQTTSGDVIGGSGGGCSAGMSVLALAVLGAFIARKR